jgi:hypothetical protein
MIVNKIFKNLKNVFLNFYLTFYQIVNKERQKKDDADNEDFDLHVIGLICLW